MRVPKGLTYAHHPALRQLQNHISRMELQDISKSLIYIDKFLFHLQYHEPVTRRKPLLTAGAEHNTHKLIHRPVGKDSQRLSGKALRGNPFKSLHVGIPSI
jgi:hypothetical protein